MAEIESITREARLYALKELARRAGVTAEYFRTWKIELGADETLVFPQPPLPQCIRFKTDCTSFWKQSRRPGAGAARRGWMRPPPEPIRALAPDFVVPF